MQRETPSERLPLRVKIWNVLVQSSRDECGLKRWKKRERIEKKRRKLRDIRGEREQRNGKKTRKELERFHVGFLFSSTSYRLPRSRAVGSLAPDYFPPSSIPKDSHTASFKRGKKKLENTERATSFNLGGVGFFSRKMLNSGESSP